MSWRLAVSLLMAALVCAAESDARKALWAQLGQPPAINAGPGITGWRFQDPTEAYSASLIASKEKPLLAGNYLIFCEGKCPPDVLALADKLPSMHQGALPVLRTYLPAKNLVPDTQRYIIDEKGLAAAVPQVPASAAAFQFGTEAVVGTYKNSKGQEILAIFDYPTPQIARGQLPEFQKIPESVVKRSGPLVAVVLHAVDLKAANQLLSDTEYAALISWDEKPPLIIRPQTAAQIVLGGLELAGIILVFCFVSGLAYAGIRILRQKFGSENADQSMIVLGLSNK